MLNELNKIMLTIFSSSKDSKVDNVFDVISEIKREQQQAVVEQTKADLQRKLEMQLASVKSIKW